MLKHTAEWWGMGIVCLPENDRHELWPGAHTSYPWKTHFTDCCQKQPTQIKLPYLTIFYFLLLLWKKYEIKIFSNASSLVFPERDERHWESLKLPQWCEASWKPIVKPQDSLITRKYLHFRKILQFLIGFLQMAFSWGHLSIYLQIINLLSEKLKGRGILSRHFGSATSKWDDQAERKIKCFEMIMWSTGDKYLFHRRHFTISRGRWSPRVSL